MIAASAKRKKTTDMPDSLPKRATRARTRAMDDVELEVKKITNITTTVAKPAPEKKKPTVPAKAYKRKAKVEDEYEDVAMTEKPAAVEHPTAKPTKAVVNRTKKISVPARASKRRTRADEEETETIEEPMALEGKSAIKQPKVNSRKTTKPQKKAVVIEEEKPLPSDSSNLKTRQPRAATNEEPKSIAPKTTRGRPKKGTHSTSVTSTAAEQPKEEAPESVKKTTRGRVAATQSKVLAITAPKPTAAATKKRVKFQEELDKENIPIETAATKKSALKVTGMKAKPLRKPTVTRGSNRSRKAVRKEVGTQDNENSEGTPLSPKKIHQIARSDPLSSEDELAGEKTPVRVLSRSPAKRPTSPVKDFGSVSKVNLNQQHAPSSPSKSMASSILSSPARRLPASPFKDALKGSPKKAILWDNIVQPALLTSHTPLKRNLLQESPKRGMLESSVKPVLHSSQSTFKKSLLQSPARRTMTSPKKAGVDDASPRTAGRIAPLSKTTPKCQEFNLGLPTSAQQNQTVASAIADTDHLYPAHRPENHCGVGGSTDMSQLSPSEPASCIGDIPVCSPAPIVQEEGNTGLTALKERHSFKSPAFSFASSTFRRISTESEVSEDELALPRKEIEYTPVRKSGASCKGFKAPTAMRDPQACSNVNISFTPLAEKLSTWNASSPSKENGTQSSHQAREVFSLGDIDAMVFDDQISSEIPATTPAKSSFFDDEIMALQNGTNQPTGEVVVEPTSDLVTFKVSLDSQASEEYGDENEAPTDPEMLRAEQDTQNITLTCTPAKVFTPARMFTQQPREYHTVSKVLLRPSDDESILHVPRQRSRSFGAPLAVADSWTVSEHKQDQVVPDEQPATSLLKATAMAQTPTSCMRLDMQTPGRTVRKGVIPDILKGAVVHVDVHTTEGADASGIFVDLLTQMGARCVKQWSWNPRASIANPLNESASSHLLSSEASADKIGITHVVFKDGSKRVLEKVSASNGIVLCVGVGWVLE